MYSSRRAAAEHTVPGAGAAATQACLRGALCGVCGARRNMLQYLRVYFGPHSQYIQVDVRQQEPA